MRSSGLSFFGSVLTVAMVALSIWIAQQAVPFSRTWSDPRLAIWAFRVGAFAVFAAAQVVVLVLVIGTLWESTAAGESLGRVAMLVFTLSLVTAVTLGLLGR